MLFLILFIAVESGAQSVGLPVDHWAMVYLQHFQNRGLISPLLMSRRPVSRDKLAREIYLIDRDYKSGKIRLSGTEIQILARLKGEFADDLAEFDIRVNQKLKERHLYRQEINKDMVYFDMFGSQEFKGKSPPNSRQYDYASHTTVGGIARGYLHPNFSFYAEAHNTLIKGEQHEQETFDPTTGQPIVLSGSNAFTDDARGYFVFDYKRLRLKLGRDRIFWGNTSDGGLMFHDNGLNYDQIHFQILWDRVRFTSLHAVLQGLTVPRFITANRIDWQPTRTLHFGLYETAVYGDRSFQPLYQLPLYVNKIAADKFGDSLNRAIGAEVNYQLLNNLNWHAEALADDFNKNRIATLIKGTLSDIPLLPNFEIAGMFYHIDRDVFTVKSEKQQYLGFQHYDRPIGLSLETAEKSGPAVMMRYFFNEKLWLYGQYEKIHLGVRYFTEPAFDPVDTALFDAHDLNSYRFEFRWEICQDLFLQGSVRSSWQKYPDYMGMSAKKQNEISISLTFNY